MLLVRPCVVIIAVLLWDSALVPGHRTVSTALAAGYICGCSRPGSGNRSGRSGPRSLPRRCPLNQRKTHTQQSSLVVRNDSRKPLEEAVDDTVTQSLGWQAASQLMLPCIILGSLLVGLPDAALAAGSSRGATLDDIVMLKEQINKKIDEQGKEQGILLKEQGVMLKDMFFYVPISALAVNAFGFGAALIVNTIAFFAVKQETNSLINRLIDGKSNDETIKKVEQKVEQSVGLKLFLLLLGGAMALFLASFLKNLGGVDGLRHEPHDAYRSFLFCDGDVRRNNILILRNAKSSLAFIVLPLL